MMLCNSMNRIAKIEHTDPKSNEPVSPINILAGVMLYFKNAIVDPAVAKAKMAISMRSIIKNQVPNVIAINDPMLADSPLMPSIRLKLLMMTNMVKMERRMLTQAGTS